MSYSLSDFDYHLPKDRIAQQPAQPRDHARLLIYERATGAIHDDYFYNLLHYLPSKTTIVANNSKVEKCRLLFDEGKKEIFVLEAVNTNTVRALVRPGKKFKEGQTLELTPKISARVTAIDEEGIRTLQLSHPISDPCYDPHRHTPFPPYITQDESLAQEYQTIYARHLGSKAAPTAGLHFTKTLKQQIADKDIPWEEVTLHVGLGTFAPVKEDNIDHHPMHTEWYEINNSTAHSLNEAEHITAVGTTSLRVLEACRQQNPAFKAEKDTTDIFIRPGYTFKGVDTLITNFHLPKSTLLMLVAAFMGFDEMHRVYKHAIAQEYRFYSFGDAMLIL